MDNELSISHCMSCNICHTQCPVAAHFTEFPGPKALAPAAERLRLAGKSTDVDSFLRFCTNCRRCDSFCPHNVKPSRYNLKNRARYSEGLLYKLRDFILAHNVWWGRICSINRPVANLALGSTLTGALLGLIGIAPRKFPLYKRGRARLQKKSGDKKALLFTGCYARFNEPEIIESAFDILGAYDFSVEIAPASCCGIPMLTNGFMDETKRVAWKNFSILSRFIDMGYLIITLCASCGLALKEEYGDLIAPEKAGKLALHSWDLFELLREEEIEPKLKGCEKLAKAYYHIPCHLRAQGIGAPAASLLRSVAISELIVEDRFCCGLSGTYGFKKEKYELSKTIGAGLFEDITQSNAPVVISDCGTCALQIADGTGLTVKHPAVVLRDYV